MGFTNVIFIKVHTMSTAKVFMHVSNRKTVGRLAKSHDVKGVMDHLLKQECDKVNVHTFENEGEMWESFSLEYNDIMPELREFLTKVGGKKEFILECRGWTWTIRVTDTTDSRPYDLSDRLLVVKIRSHNNS
jgi:hypothetical protein